MIIIYAGGEHEVVGEEGVFLLLRCQHANAHLCRAMHIKHIDVRDWSKPDKKSARVVRTETIYHRIHRDLTTSDG